jgi:hypothetical protein
MIASMTYSNLPITDWIQAIGIIFGFPAAMWSIISLFRKDKNRQIEIDSLVALVTNQSVMLQKMNEQIEIEKRKHHLMIMPFLNIVDDPEYVGNKFILKISNRGGRCKLLGYLWDYSDSIEIDTFSRIGEFVETGNDFSIVGSNITNKTAYNEGCFSIWLYYEDIEQHLYYQKIIKGRNIFLIERPIQYEGSIELIVQKTARYGGTTYIH